NLHVKTDITPHSARVSVISHSLHFLPAEFIGKYMTGQSPKVVWQYFKTDPEDLEREKLHQGMVFRDHILKKKAGELVTNPRKFESSFCKADTVNSMLARSMRTDVNETIASYGCISIS